MTEAVLNAERPEKKEKILEKTITANCPSCKVEGSNFDYIGLNDSFLTPQNRDFFLKKYGEEAFVLYGCGACSSSLTLKTIQDYKN